ncbi:MAG: HPP family protein, partial [Candidatus Bathyarchaeia archaeon]
MLVQEIMDRSYPILYEDELATKARATLRSRGLRVLPIVDDQKRVVGMVSRGDVMTITSSVSPIRVKGVMSTPRFVAPVGMDAFYAGREMIRFDEWYVPVVKSSQDYAYMGVLGLEGFIGAFLRRGVAKLSRVLSRIMSTEPVTCSPDDEVDNVWHLMRERAFAGLPVVKSGRVVGMVTQKNLLDSGVIFPVFEARRGRFKAP